jgi:hypothetical protein
MCSHRLCAGLYKVMDCRHVIWRGHDDDWPRGKKAREYRAAERGRTPSRPFFEFPQSWHRFPQSWHPLAGPRIRAQAIDMARQPDRRSAAAACTKRPPCRSRAPRHHGWAVGAINMDRLDATTATAFVDGEPENDRRHRRHDGGEDSFAGPTLAEQRVGMNSLGLHGAAHMAPFMPLPMQEIGTSMHRAASRLAIVLQDTAPAQAHL